MTFRYIFKGQNVSKFEFTTSHNSEFKAKIAVCCNYKLSVGYVSEFC